MINKKKLWHQLAILLCFVTLFTLAILQPKATFATTLELLLYQEPLAEGEFPVFVYLDTEGQNTIGTDLFITYDPRRVLFSRAQEGSLYETYHKSLNDSTRGRLRYSATNSFQQYSQEKGLFATLYFYKKPDSGSVLPIDNQEPAIKLLASGTNTADSNVVASSGLELLTQDPPPLQVDPNLETKIGDILGSFSEEEATLLQNEGIIQKGEVLGIASEVRSNQYWLLFPILIFILIPISAIFYWRYLKLRKD